MKRCGHKKSLVGERFGRLVILSCLSEVGEKHPKWDALCDCGKHKVVTTTNLARGKTKSCGCLRQEVSKERLSKTHIGKKSDYGVASLNVLLGRYRGGALKRGLTFELSLSQFAWLTKQPCYYCGALPRQILYMKKLNGTYIYNGVDRMNNTLGYSIDNVVPCCGECNRIKLNIDHDAFLSKVTKIYNKLVNPLMYNPSDRYTPMLNMLEMETL